MISHMPVAVTCGSDWAFYPRPGIEGSPKTPHDPGWDPNSPGVCLPGRISYEPLSSAAAGQDFRALLYGDCTRNWTYGGGGGSTEVEAIESEDAADGPAVSLSSPPACEGACAALVSADGAACGSAALVVGVNNLAGAQAFDLAVDVPAGVQVTAVRKAELAAAAGDCSLVWAANGAKLRISLACVTPISGGGALLSVETQGASAAAPELSKCVFDEKPASCASSAASGCAGQ